jgi:glyoxylase-like metal-dependent hydrolase (beta-lactamase superfamily II)
LGNRTWQIVEGEGSAAVYSYLLEGTREAVLIDTGYGTIDLKAIVAELTGLPVCVFLTHGHVDHIGGTGAFEKVYLKAADRDLYRLHATEQMRRIFLGEEHAAPVKDISQIMDYALLTDHQNQYDLGGRPLTIIDTPGHSVGCICIWDVKNRWLFTGDMCCKADVLLNMEYAAPLEIYAKSIERILTLDFATTWPGHHTCPVNREVIAEFEEAAQDLLAGRAVGIKMQHPAGDAMRYEYKNIAIVYKHLQ